MPRDVVAPIVRVVCGNTRPDSSRCVFCRSFHLSRLHLQETFTGAIPAAIITAFHTDINNAIITLIEMEKTLVGIKGRCPFHLSTMPFSDEGFMAWVGAGSKRSFGLYNLGFLDDLLEFECNKGFQAFHHTEATHEAEPCGASPGRPSGDQSPLITEHGLAQGPAIV